MLPVCLALRYPTLARRGSKIEWSDWNIFSRHSFYLLLGGYFGVADQQVNTILINKMGSVDLAGNSLIGTMMSYPYIFAGAFGTVISTLGSKYIGQRDDRAYLKLGLVMVVASAAIGFSLGTVVVFFAGKSRPMSMQLSRPVPSNTEDLCCQMTCCTSSRTSRT